MKSLLIATTNAAKAEEFKALLQPHFRCQFPSDPTFKTISPPEVIENGKSYSENALKKARAFHQAYQVPVLSDDSGLEIQPLAGAPGIHSARWGGENLTWPERWDLIYKELKNIPHEKWIARFVCVLCYFDGKTSAKFYDGVADGTLTPKPQGSNGFGYDPIFFSPELKKSYGEATFEEKLLVSHRARACHELIQWVKAGRIP